MHRLGHAIMQRGSIRHVRRVPASAAKPAPTRPQLAPVRNQFCEFRPEGPLSGFASEHRRVVRNRNLLLALFLVRGGALGLRGLEAYP